MTPDQIIATVMSILSSTQDPSAFPTVTAGGADPAFPLTVEACPRPLPTGDIEGKTIICGRIDVPERHAQPDGRRISLAFSVMKSRSQSPASDPVIYLHGGPGGGAVAELSSLVAPLFDHYRSRRDVVTFDQRAAGISSDMVTCFETFEGNIYNLFTGAATDAETEKLLADCLAELKEGRDIAAYTTPENARDVQTLMRTLGYKEWNLYGVSYGTKLALEVMRTVPEGTRSVVLDSVAPPQSRYYDENMLPIAESIDAVVKLCAEDAKCNAAYPDLKGTILRVAEELEKSPIPAQRGRPEVTLTTLVDMFKNRNSYGNWPRVTAHIPLILTEWDRGETTTWDMISAGGTARPPTTAERLKPYMATLSADQRTLAALLLEGATAGKVEEAARSAAVGALEASIMRAGSGTQGLAGRFDEAVTRAITATNSREAMLAFARAYADLSRQTPSRAVLESLVRDHLPATEVEGVLALLAQMTDGDVADVFSAVGGEFRSKINPLVGVIDLALVGCQEDVPFNSPEGYDAFNAALPYPFLNRPTFTADNLYIFCKDLPPALPFETFHDPVVSDIPTLVLWGYNDTQTSMKDAMAAAAPLPNSQIVGFPEAGHGSILFSQCARDIGVAFVERPDEKVNATCTESLKPVFVLPPG